MRRLILSALATLVFTLSINAQSLLRGPYLQALTQTSVKIMWRTSEPTTGWVKFGNSPDNLQTVVSETGSVTNHIVDITGLNPYQQYYYEIGFDNISLAGATDKHFFKTAKITGDTTGFSAWTIGDFGKGNIELRDTRNAFENYTSSKPVDFGIMLGDNAYSDGTDSEYQTKMFDMPNGLADVFRNLQFYATPGNHDYNSVNRLDDPLKHEGPYFEVFKAITNGEAGGVPSNSKLYYSFDYGHTHFVNINSELIQWTGFNGSPMENWLRADLEANKQPWTVVFFHQPPYASGSHVSDDLWQLFMKNMRERFNPIFDKYSVDLVMCGHSHAYERSMMIHGHYGRSGVFDPAKHVIQGGTGNPDTEGPYIKQPGGKGTVYAVIGNSGSSEGDMPAKAHPIFVARDGGSSVCGSLVLEVRGSTLTGTYVDSKGAVKDKFSIFKQIAQSTPVKENYADKIGLIAFPNPSSEYLRISFNGEKYEKGNILITDISGRQMLSQTIQTDQGQMNYSVDNWSKLAAGSYIVNVEVNGKPASITVVKGQ